MQASEDLFERVTTFPDPAARRRYSQLVGLESIKDRLVKETLLRLDRQALERWSNDYHAAQIPAVDLFLSRPPLFVFAGDVGTGKTALAETFGDTVARTNDIPVTLYRLSLNTRGSGAVGQMTRLISAAFQTIEEAARRLMVDSQRSRGGVILLIDEADAIVQSRALDQMHHEDRAGVNAVVRGIDTLAVESLPAVVVMCTNRPESLDPAVLRRAAEVFEFRRPNSDQRAALFREVLAGLNLPDDDILRLAEGTGPQGAREYGFTYSDIVQRLLPTAILTAFPDHPLTIELLLGVVAQVEPTPSFGGDDD